MRSGWAGYDWRAVDPDKYHCSVYYYFLVEWTQWRTKSSTSSTHGAWRKPWDHGVNRCFLFDPWSQSWWIHFGIEGNWGRDFWWTAVHHFYHDEVIVQQLEHSRVELATATLRNWIFLEDATWSKWIRDADFVSITSVEAVHTDGRGRVHTNV